MCLKLQSNEVIKVKMNYTAPEAKLLGFAPAEATATENPFEELLGGGQGEEAKASDGDITVEGVSF